MPPIELFTEEELARWGVPPDTPITVTRQLAGGIALSRSHFIVDWLDSDLPVHYLLLTPEGEPIARFDKDRTVKIYRKLDFAEIEAVEGMKRLVLQWQ